MHGPFEKAEQKKVSAKDVNSDKSGKTKNEQKVENVPSPRLPRIVVKRLCWCYRPKRRTVAQRPGLRGYKEVVNLVLKPR
jgi:hypothetical protein